MAGAPKKRWKDKKNIQLAVYANEDQEPLIKEAAKLAGMSLSTFLLTSALNRAEFIMESVSKRTSAK
jgi:uncharacterized protein (DUF1778 family)